VCAHAGKAPHASPRCRQPAASPCHAWRPECSDSASRRTGKTVNATGRATASPQTSSAGCSRAGSSITTTNWHTVDHLAGCNAKTGTLCEPERR
ncbi:MAG TPA: hypothetical protein PKC25_04060, partial [Candidatus Rifleibacterium sp.]|nr:hypothetical protein [Candidatus Rifleibacterium sp.]